MPAPAGAVQRDDGHAAIQRRTQFFRGAEMLVRLAFHAQRMFAPGVRQQHHVPLGHLAVVAGGDFLRVNVHRGRQPLDVANAALRKPRQLPHVITAVRVHRADRNHTRPAARVRRRRRRQIAVQARAQIHDIIVRHMQVGVLLGQLAVLVMEVVQRIQVEVAFNRARRVTALHILKMQQQVQQPLLVLLFQQVKVVHAAGAHERPRLQPQIRMENAVQLRVQVGAAARRRRAARNGVQMMVRQHQPAVRRIKCKRLRQQPLRAIADVRIHLRRRPTKLPVNPRTTPAQQRGGHGGGCQTFQVIHCHTEIHRRLARFIL